jgi:hypothetical protein
MKRKIIQETGDTPTFGKGYQTLPTDRISEQTDLMDEVIKALHWSMRWNYKI